MPTYGIFSRPPRLVIAAFLAVTFIYLALSISTNHPYKLSDARQLPKQLSGSLQEYLSKFSTHLDEDVHKLTSADQFFPHIEKVLQLPGLTIEEAAKTCTWSEEDHVPFQYSYREGDTGFTNASWILHSPPNEEIAENREIWQDFLKKDVLAWEDYKHRYSGRGLVILGGNGKTIERVKSILRQLRRLGSTLPVEMHYWLHELNDESKKELESLWHITFHDLAEPSNVFGTGYSMFWQNFQMKSAAILNSKFSEVLLLDSDNIPVIPPEELFESRTFKEYGSVFWMDIARTRPNNPIWAITNTPCVMDEWEQESGQLLVDKSRFFYHLQISHYWANNYMNYFNNILLGDKDTFRFAWHALKTKYGSPAKYLSSVGMHFPSADGGDFYCGHHFAQYHPDAGDGRVAFMHGGTYKAQARQLLAWGREEAGGTFTVYKKVPTDDPRAIYNVHLQWTGAEFLPERYGEPERSSICTQFDDIEARPFDELVPGWERIWEEIGGYWMLDNPKYKDIPI